MDLPVNLNLSKRHDPSNDEHTELNGTNIALLLIFFTDTPMVKEQKIFKSNSWLLFNLINHVIQLVSRLPRSSADLSRT